MAFANWIWKSSTMRCSLLITIYVGFKVRKTWLQISGLQLTSCMNIPLKLFSLKAPKTFFWLKQRDIFQFLCYCTTLNHLMPMTTFLFPEIFFLYFWLLLVSDLCRLFFSLSFKYWYSPELVIFSPHLTFFLGAIILSHAQTCNILT